MRRYFKLARAMMVTIRDLSSVHWRAVSVWGLKTVEEIMAHPVLKWEHRRVRKAWEDAVDEFYEQKPTQH